MKSLLVIPAFLMGTVAFGQIGPGELPVNDLIAWTGMQTPQPVQPASQNAAPDAPQPDPSVHAITGSISKEGGSYVLKVSDTTSYKLDDQAKAKPFNGQKVRVVGQVDLENNQIHVQKIEPIV